MGLFNGAVRKLICNEGMNMVNKFTLNDMSYGERAQIKAVHISGAMRRRLLDTGFIDGAEIIRLFSGISGEPTAFMINGTVTALRSEEMRMVEVSRAEAGQLAESIGGCRAWV